MWRLYRHRKLADRANRCQSARSDLGGLHGYRSDLNGGRSVSARISRNEPALPFHFGLFAGRLCHRTREPDTIVSAGPGPRHAL